MDTDGETGRRSKGDAERLTQETESQADWDTDGHGTDRPKGE